MKVFLLTPLPIAARFLLFDFLSQFSQGLNDGTWEVNIAVRFEVLFSLWAQKHLNASLLSGMVGVLDFEIPIHQEEAERKVLQEGTEALLP